MGVQFGEQSSCEQSVSLPSVLHENTSCMCRISRTKPTAHSLNQASNFGIDLKNEQDKAMDHLKKKIKSCKGKCPKKIHVRKRPNKKFMHKMSRILTLNQNYSFSRKVMSVYEPRGPSGRSLSRFP